MTSMLFASFLPTLHQRETVRIDIVRLVDIQFQNSPSGPKSDRDDE